MKLLLILLMFNFNPNSYHYNSIGVEHFNGSCWTTTTTISEHGVIIIMNDVVVVWPQDGDKPLKRLDIKSFEDGFILLKDDNKLFFEHQSIYLQKKDIRYKYILTFH